MCRSSTGAIVAADYLRNLLRKADRGHEARTFSGGTGRLCCHSVEDSLSLTSVLREAALSDCKQRLNGRFCGRRMSAVGREYAVPTGRLQKAEFQWPLSGDELSEQTDATRPEADGRPSECRPSLDELQRPFDGSPQRRNAGLDEHPRDGTREDLQRKRFQQHGWLRARYRT